MSELIRKLNPRRFPGMSPLMAAIVGFVLGESFTDPVIAEITVSESEGFVYLRQEGAVGFDGFQSLEDLRQNWNRLLDVAGLEPEERTEAVRLFHAKVEKVKGTEL
jgi:hypothetical protein